MNNNASLHFAFLILEPYSGRGGTEQALINMINELALTDIRSSILFLHPPTHLDFLEYFAPSTYIEIAEPYISPAYLPAFLKRNHQKKYLLTQTVQLINHCQKRARIDALIFVDISKQLIRTGKIIKNFKKDNVTSAVIGWPHLLFNEQRPKEIKSFQKLFKYFDLFLAVSEGMKGELQRVIPEQKIKLIYNPITVASIIEQKKNSFLYIGRIDDEQKNFLGLLKILSQLKGHWHLDVYGDIPHPERKRSLLKMCHDLNIDQNITFHGWVNAPWEQISEASLLLLNSNYESFGLVLVEAMIRGIPCISTDCPVGPRELIKNNLNGWLVNSPEEYIATLQKILDSNKTLPSEQVRNSVLKFSSNQVAHKFKRALEEVIYSKSSKN